MLIPIELNKYFVLQSRYHCGGGQPGELTRPDDALGAKPRVRLYRRGGDAYHAKEAGERFGDNQFTRTVTSRVENLSMHLVSLRSQLIRRVVIERRRREPYPPEALSAVSFICTLYST